MSYSPRGWSVEHIVGVVVLAIFAAGVVGAVVAVLLNNGDVPSQIATQSAQTAAPL